MEAELEHRTSLQLSALADASDEFISYKMWAGGGAGGCLQPGRRCHFISLFFLKHFIANSSELVLSSFGEGCTHWASHVRIASVQLYCVLKIKPARKGGLDLSVPGEGGSCLWGAALVAHLSLSSLSSNSIDLETFDRAHFD